MSNFMNGVARQFRIELWASWLSRSALAVLVAVLLGSGVAIIGGFSAARNADHRVVMDLGFAATTGGTLEDALSEPYSVEQQGDQTTISNPLHYHYVAAINSIRAISGGPIPVISGIVEAVAFLIMPLALAFFGASSASDDLRQRTMKLRAAGDSWRAITVGKLLTIPAVSVVAVVITVLIGLIASLIIRQDMLGLSSGIVYDMAYGSQGAPLVLKLLFAWVMGTFFGVLGYALGAIFRSRLWVTVLAAVFLLAVTFLGRADPRNCLLVLGSSVTDGWGALTLNAPIPLGKTAAVGIVAAYLVVALVLAFVFPRPSRRYGK